MPSAISCNISQQPDLNLMIEDDGGFVYDTSFQFPPTTTVSNNTNNVAALSVKQRRTAQQEPRIMEKKKLSEAI